MTIHRAILTLAAKLYKNRPLAVSPSEVLTFRQIFSEAEQLAKELQRLNQPIIGLNIENSPRHIVGKIALILSKKIGLFLHPALGQEKIKAILERAGTNWVLEEDGGKTILRHYPISTPNKPNLPPSTFSLNLSSGSTGPLPKIVAHSESSWLTSTWRIIRYQKRKTRGAIRFLCLPPLSMAGSISFLPILLSGGCYVFPRPGMSQLETIEQLQAIIEELQPTQIYLTPRQLNKAINQRYWYRPVSVLRISSGTEPLLPSTIKRTLETLAIELSTGYGMVECLPPLTSFLFTPEDVSSEKLMESAGKILPGVKITLEGPYLAVSSSTLMLGYITGGEVDRGTRTQGYLLTQDYGRIENGFVYIYGRETDRLGPTTFSRQVEEYLHQTLPGLIDAAVVKKDESRIIVAVERANKIPIDWEETRRKLKERFPELKDRELILKESSVPLMFTGKLDRRALINA